MTSTFHRRRGVHAGQRRTGVDEGAERPRECQDRHIKGNLAEQSKGFGNLESVMFDHRRNTDKHLGLPSLGGSGLDTIGGLGLDESAIRVRNNRSIHGG